jgi:putative PEP-CTERM system TPR-repeat lipoprotein
MTRQTALLSMVLAASLAAAPAFANPARDRALLAQSRGEMRAAQIEWRNAVRAEPQQGALRAGLAEASIEIGDMDTAEREARAALERGYDRATGTALLLRILLAQGRFQDVLAQFPEPGEQSPPAVAAQIFAGRAFAQLATNDREASRASVARAEQLDPSSVETAISAANQLIVEGNRAGAEARLDRILATQPRSRDALLAKAQMQLDRDDAAGALESFGRVITATPGHVPARVRRAELLLRLNEIERARVDIDGALAAMPNNARAAYLRAMQLTMQRNWRAADGVMQQIGPQLTNFPDGLLLQAIAKRGLGQNAQAEDAARRHVARFPEDPRGARLLATMEMDAGRPRDAAAVLARAAVPTTRDVELLEMLGRAYAAAGLRAEAAQTLERAAAVAPNDAALLTRLAVARLALGDVQGTRDAVAEALRQGPARPGAREILAATAIARGDLAEAEAALAALDPAAQRGEVASVLTGNLQLIRLDLPGARAAFEQAIRQAPETRIGRIGLARVAILEGKPAEAQGLLADVLRRDPANAEAIRRLGEQAQAAGEAGDAALATLTAVQAERPAEPALALAAATLLVRRREFDRALAILEAAPLRQMRGPVIGLARSEVLGAAGRWGPAEAAAREALAEDPGSVQARVQLARLRLREDDVRPAEGMLREGLRATPAQPALQQALVGLILDRQGLEAALAEADRMAAQPAALPAAASLRGEVLMAARRPEEAAGAFATALAATPGPMLTQRLAAAWMAAGQPNRAAAALRDRLRVAPEDRDALGMLAQYDLQAGRTAEAEARLRELLAATPENAVALNNLAWILGERGDPAALAEARGYAERAYNLAPNPDIADTLGWILARSGDARLAVLLLRRAGPGEGGGAYRFAYALREAGEREEAQRVLATALANDTAFPERAMAERLRDELGH